MMPFSNCGGIEPHSTKRLVELGTEYVTYSGGRSGTVNKMTLVIESEFKGVRAQNLLTYRFFLNLTAVRQ